MLSGAPPSEPPLCLPGVCHALAFHRKTAYHHSKGKVMKYSPAEARGWKRTSSRSPKLKTQRPRRKTCQPADIPRHIEEQHSLTHTHTRLPAHTCALITQLTAYEPVLRTCVPQYEHRHALHVPMSPHYICPPPHTHTHTSVQKSDFLAGGLGQRSPSPALTFEPQ